MPHATPPLTPTPIARRSTVMLYLAMTLAVGCGLGMLPPLDPLEALRQPPDPLGGVAALLHLGLASLGMAACRRALQRQGSRWAARRWLVWGGHGVVAVAWLWWLGSWQLTPTADARALLWLEMLPLWLWPAGLLDLRMANRPEDASGVAALGRAPLLQALPYGFEHSGLFEQIDVAGLRHRQSFTTGPHRQPGREHDAVTGAVEAQHGRQP